MMSRLSLLLLRCRERSHSLLEGATISRLSLPSVSCRVRTRHAELAILLLMSLLSLMPLMSLFLSFRVHKNPVLPVATSYLK